MRWDRLEERVLELIAAQMLELARLNKQGFTKLHTELRKIMATIAEVEADVARQSTVADSIVALLQGVAQQLKDLIAAGSVTPAELQTVIDGIDANTTKLSDAVTANTPA
jgi:DNA gyrase/topoisomerase IV subunit A